MPLRLPLLIALPLVSSVVGCATTPARAPADPTFASRSMTPVATPYLGPTPVEPEDAIEILADDPEAIAAAETLIAAMNDWGPIGNAYADTLECFNGRDAVPFDTLLAEADSPTPPDYALGWATVASIEALEATRDEAILLVRGAAALASELGVELDERIVKVRKLDIGWRIVGESNRMASGCMAERWQGMTDDPALTRCDQSHRECLLAIDEEALCGGFGCACNECVSAYDACNEAVAACLTAPA